MHSRVGPYPAKWWQGGPTEVALLGVPAVSALAARFTGVSCRLGRPSCICHAYGKPQVFLCAEDVQGLVCAACPGLCLLVGLNQL